jgi:hypothetical protein
MNSTKTNILFRLLPYVLTSLFILLPLFSFAGGSGGGTLSLRCAEGISRAECEANVQTYCTTDIGAAEDTGCSGGSGTGSYWDQIEERYADGGVSGGADGGVAGTGDGGVSGGSSQILHVTWNSPIKTEYNTLEKLIVGILDALIILAIPIITLMIIYAGFLYVTARGNAEQVRRATNALTYAIIGGVLVIGAVAITGIIEQTISEF